MYVLSELFGDCPQVNIVETFAENHEDTLSGPDISRMTGVTKATVYCFRAPWKNDEKKNGLA